MGAMPNLVGDYSDATVALVVVLVLGAVADGPVALSSPGAEVPGACAFAAIARSTETRTISVERTWC
jgi:hypothetical protein